jgi:hypothetical protein
VLNDSARNEAEKTRKRVGLDGPSIFVLSDVAIRSSLYDATGIVEKLAQIAIVRVPDCKKRNRQAMIDLAFDLNGQHVDTKAERDFKNRIFELILAV